MSDDARLSEIQRQVAEIIIESLRGEVARLKEDQADWRKGVALIASSLGDPAENLSCARIAELGLQLRARLEDAEAELTRLRHVLEKVWRGWDRDASETLWLELMDELEEAVKSLPTSPPDRPAYKEKP